jgi:TetR/AcrR family transcriptional repressor of nem operon
MSGRPREFDEKVVLDAAMDLFWERGYEATGIAELSERCGIGRQSMYNAFGDKHSLFEQALQCYARDRIGGLVAMLDAPGSPLANVNRVLDTWEQTWTEDEFKGCMMVNAIAELGERDPELTARLDTMLQSIEDAFYRALRRAQEEGELPLERDPRALARTITAVGQGMAVVSKVASSPTYAHDVLSVARQLLS